MVASASGYQSAIPGSFYVFERVGGQFQQTQQIDPIPEWGREIDVSRPNGTLEDGTNFGYGLAAGHGLIVACAWNLGNHPGVPDTFVYKKNGSSYQLVRAFHDSVLPTNVPIGFAVEIFDADGFIISYGNGAWYTTTTLINGAQRDFQLAGAYGCTATPVQQIAVNRQLNATFVATLGCIYYYTRPAPGGTFNYVGVLNLQTHPDFQNFGMLSTLPPVFPIQGPPARFLFLFPMGRGSFNLFLVVQTHSLLLFYCNDF